jgi:hypothetical protein
LSREAIGDVQTASAPVRWCIGTLAQAKPYSDAAVA